jgi:hypothetical protein
MKSKEIKEYVNEKGYLHLSVLFEIVGNPKEHVENMIKKVIDGVKSNKGIIVFDEEFGDAEDAGEGLWGVFCETEMLIKDLNILSWLAFNFSPASIEIKAPKELVIKDKKMTDFMGDLLSQLHQSNMNTIRAKSETKELLLNFNALARNAVFLAIGSDKKTPVEVAKVIGMTPEGISPVLEAMVKEKTLNKEGDKYFRV